MINIAQKPKPVFTITSCIEVVAESLPRSAMNDIPAIRTIINDTLDAYSKAGYRVRFDYDQPRAVRIVRALLRNRL